jgi:hypothetical protein
MSEAVRHSELVFNLDFYPRGEVDEERVDLLVEVLKAGKELPPIVIDQKRRIVDGFHRAKAYRRAFSAGDPEIPCEIREYASDAELLLDAIGANAQHGKPLSVADRRKCVVLADRHGVTVEQLADVLNVRVGRLSSIAETSTTKATVRSAEKRLIEREAKAYNDPTGGGVYTPPVGLRQINEILTSIRAGKLNLEDRMIRLSLENLAREITVRMEVILTA